VDRKKDLIIRNGHNVYPSDIETVLSEHPAVQLSAVIGVPDDKVGAGRRGPRGHIAESMRPAFPTFDSMVGSKGRTAQ